MPVATDKAELMLEARHEVANAAAAVAMVNSHIARALAWPMEPDKVASQKSSLKAALGSLRAAADDLQAALVRMEIATRENA